MATAQKIGAGTKVVLTKINDKPGHLSSTINGSATGVLQTDAEQGGLLRLEQDENTYFTSNIVILNAENKEITLETTTACYSIKIVEDKKTKPSSN